MPVETGVSGAAGAGSLKVSGTSGEELATEAEQQEQTAALETVASTVTVGVPLAGDLKVGVTIGSSATIPVEIVAGQLATAQPEDGSEGVRTYVVGMAPAVPVGEGDKAMPVVVLGTANITGEVSQGRGASADTADPWIVATSDGVAAKQIATKEGQDAELAAVDELETKTEEIRSDADATRIAVESINTKTPALGPQTMAGSQSIVFATDHPILGSELYVGLTPLSNANPVPVRGIVPSRTPTGTPTFVSSGQIGTDGSGALLYLRMHVPSPAGTRYILLFDAAAATPLATTNMIPGITFPFTPTLGRAEQRFGYPVGFVNGLQWAVSSTEHTYTASGDTANVFAQWVMS